MVGSLALAVGALAGVAGGAAAARLGLVWARGIDPAAAHSFAVDGGAAARRRVVAVASLVVLGAGVWGAALGAWSGPVPIRAGLAVLGLALVVHVVTDALARRVVRSVSHAALAAGVLAGATQAARGDATPLARGAVAAVAALALALVTARLSRGGLAVGDVRLLPAIAWHLGARDATAPVVALAVAAVAGALHASWLLARGAGRRARLPFAPSLALGAVAALVSAVG